MVKDYKKRFFSNGAHFIILAASFVIMFFGVLKFLLVSLIFILLAAVFEGVIMNRFVSNGKEKISKKDSITKQIKNGSLWVHGIMHFIKKYNLTIYHSEKIGNLTGVISYFVIFLYVVVAYLLYQVISYFAFVIYLIPIITNIIYYFKYSYYILDFSKKK